MVKKGKPTGSRKNPEARRSMLLVPFGGTRAGSGGKDDGAIAAKAQPEDELKELRETVHGKPQRRSSVDDTFSKGGAGGLHTLAQDWAAIEKLQKKTRRRARPKQTEELNQKFQHYLEHVLQRSEKPGHHILSRPARKTLWKCLLHIVKLTDK